MRANTSGEIFRTSETPPVERFPLYQNALTARMRECALRRLRRLRGDETISPETMSREWGNEGRRLHGAIIAHIAHARREREECHTEGCARTRGSELSEKVSQQSFPR